MYYGMLNDSISFTENRFIFENDQILVMHQIGGFSDGIQETILVMHIIKNGKIVMTETGATLI
tara:strand:- start:4199 stop:4387 length:189 start_codon:yes stop_codon:yes gene_type:complete